MPALQSQYLHDKIADQIKQLIEESVLIAGDKVPSVRAMSKQAGVSISTILQAYANLEADGIIQAKPQSGYFVSQQATNNIDIPERIRWPKLKPKPALAFNVWGAIYESAMRDDILPLGLAIPDTTLLPVNGLNSALRQVLKKQPDAGFHYSFPPGEVAIRRQIAAQYFLRNHMVDPDDIIITNGCTEALMLSLKTVAQPGDVIAVESPIYFLLIRVIKSLGLTVIEIESDPQTGMSIEVLERAINNIQISAVICIPNFSNPNGTLMPDEKKQRLVSLLSKKQIPLIEDDIYGDLYFGDERPSNCSDFETKGNVLTCSSFSKTLAPGFRIGWILAGKYREKIIQNKRLSSAATSTLAQLAIANFLQSGAYQRQLKKLRPTLKQQVYLMRQTIAKYFPQGTRISNPQGGFVLWVQLPKKAGLSFDTLALAERAMDEKIGLAPGMMFSVSDQYTHFLRLSAGFEWNEIAETGIKRLGELIETLSQKN